MRKFKIILLLVFCSSSIFAEYDYPFLYEFYFGRQPSARALPLNKLANVPLKINLDFTSLPQPSYINSDIEYDNFTSLNLRINWIFNKK